jgi:hypothetical protein
LKKIAKHIIITVLVAAIFFVVASLPVEFIGCRGAEFGR